MTNDFFPDGTEIADFFYDGSIPLLHEYGKRYVITDYGIKNDNEVHTRKIQELIDKIHLNGGGCIVIPKGIYKTGALHLKQGVNLFIEEGGTLLGSDDISDYPVCETRIEGETCLYFPALINADSVDRLKIGGKGTIDGNGIKSWQAFWIRRKWNPDCTNKDEQRPRLLYLSGCTNVVISGITMQNSHYWTNHIYKCQYVKFLDLKILSPKEPIKAPSTDAIDIDVCTDVLIKGCYMSVNDDAVALKGGKGKMANLLPENGSNQRIVIEDCKYGFCHSCLTFGSESVHDRNIIMRRISVDSGFNLIWLKFRPDTPQHYEFCKVCEVDGQTENFLNVYRWKQFAERDTIETPSYSKANDFDISYCDVKCKRFYSMSELGEDFDIKRFALSDICVQANEKGSCPEFIKEVNVTLTID